MIFHIERRMTWRGKRWFWNCRALNGKIIMSGQSSGFANRADVEQIIKNIRKNAAYGKISGGNAS